MVKSTVHKLCHYDCTADTLRTQGCVDRVASLVEGTKRVRLVMCEPLTARALLARDKALCSGVG